MAVAGVLAAGLFASGCGRVDAALSRQWATVNFRADTTTATVARVKAACGGLPGLRPAPAGAVPGLPAAALRFDVSRASTADLVRLQDCLMHFRAAVTGVSVKDMADQG